MTGALQSPTRVAIACGGTGGHLFPGLAVAAQLLERNCRVTLLISPKEVDQQAVQSVTGMEIVALPAVGLTGGRRLAFLLSSIRSYKAVKQLFRPHPPQVALAMGGFTSAPPILAARRLGAPTFLHESNTIPGRANRLLSRLVTGAFVGFPGAAKRLHTRFTTVTGTPVRAQFQPRSAAGDRAALGFDPVRPVIVVMGGSQGARGINDLVARSLPLLAKTVPDWQWFHLTGPDDAEKLRQAYLAAKVRAVVHPFFAGVETALGAASAVISRAGASSLAELAAMRVPSLLVPFPAAMDDHQLYNARAFEETGAARLLEQKAATPEALSAALQTLVQDQSVRQQMQKALAGWHTPNAAAQIAEIMLASVRAGVPVHPAKGVEGSGRATGATRPPAANFEAGPVQRRAA